MYQPKVVSCKSRKHNDQMYKVVASEEISNDFIRYIKEGNLNVSEKFDGTCCLVAEFHGRPWLWARHDIKPNKQADKRFKAYQHSKNEHILSGSDEQLPNFVWDRHNDFKEAPEDWIAASGVDKEEVLPDDIGHMVGWVPVDPSLRQHLWHLSAVNFNDGVALFLNDSILDGPIKIQVCKLEKYKGKTFELIGTHVNGNPYKLGCKKNPIHVLVQHGEFTIKEFPDFESGLTHYNLINWFNKQFDGHVEGIVWHAHDGQMFKLHRHHLDLKWPIENLRLSSRVINIDMSKYEANGYNHNTLFEKLKTIDGKTFANSSELSNENFEKS